MPTAATLTVVAKVKAAGGWDKFVAEYKERIAAAVDAELARKAETKED